MADATPFAELLLRLSVFAFMAGNLLAIGLATDLADLLAPLRDTRFVGATLLLDWLVCPAFAWLLTAALPLELPYATGLMLVGLTPAAPFLPIMVRRAGGDLGYAATFMILSAFGTVLVLPLAVPAIVSGLSVATWTVAEPLVLLMLLPLAAGLALRRAAPAVAAFLLPLVRPVATAATVLLLGVIVVRYADAFLAAVGSFAIAAQLLYCVGLIAVGHAFGAGMHPARRGVLSLGTGTRNLGAAVAPLLSSQPDPRTMAMIALTVPVTLAVTFVAAGWLSGRSSGRMAKEAGERR